MADNTARSKSNQVFDVSQPGKTPPSATSKPIIVGRGPMIKDRTLTVSDNDTKDDVENESSPEPSKVISGNGKTVQPLSTFSDSADDTDTPEIVEKTMDEVSEKPEQEKKDTAKDTKETAGTTDVTEADELEESKEPRNTVVDAVLDQATQKKNSAESNASNVAQDEKIQQLIDEKKYFVKTGHTDQANKALNVMLVIVIVASLVAGLLYVAHSQGYIKLPL
ncbi:hypothetical protein BH23PAT2_BH23PAT2_06690 [soil metagenome]